MKPLPGLILGWQKSMCWRGSPATTAYRIQSLRPQNWVKPIGTGSRHDNGGKYFPDRYPKYLVAQDIAVFQRQYFYNDY